VANLSLGKYTLIGEIARGGMGIVYLAQTQGPGGFKKTVVVKELKPELSDDPKFRDMFLEEANLAARLNHRNIVQTNEVGQDGDRYFIAMDYLEGCSLHTARKRLLGERKLPLAAQLRVVSEILAGLHYAHELTDYDGTPMGVVHRDVGPQNVFLTYDGQVKLIDFGVAKVLNREQETQAGVLKGRVVYMAPEQVASGTIDRRADIFATGVLLREVITGKRLWDGLSEIDTLKKLIARAIPELPADGDIPAELRAICEKAMAPDREDRFKTAHEMRVRIEQYVARADPTGSLADLGAHLSRELAAERLRLKDIVDGHLAAGSSDRLPAVDILAPGSSPDLLSGVGSGPRASSGPSAAPSTARRAKTPASGTLVSGEMPEIDVAADDRPANDARRKRSAVIAVAVIAAAVGISTLMLVRRNAERAPSAPISNTSLGATAPPPPTASGPPVEERAENIEITVRVTPSNARIFLDEAPVDGNPYHATFARNVVATHAIRAVAPGFVQRTELVKFDANSNVTMSLERQALAGQPQQPAVVVRADVRAAATPPAAAPPSQSPTTTTKPSATDINPRGGKVPKREIDGKNPYGAE
jgi:serine/threonine protein kinase